MSPDHDISPSLNPLAAGCTSVTLGCSGCLASLMAMALLLFLLLACFFAAAVLAC